MAVLVLVSGDITLKQWLRECLDEAKYEIVTATSAGEGLRTLETLYADGIIFDTAVGDMSGQAFVQWIRGQYQFQDLPVLFLFEPSPDPRAERTLVRSERERLLRRPLDRSDVQREVEELLSLPREGPSSKNR